MCTFFSGGNEVAAGEPDVDVAVKAGPDAGDNQEVERNRGNESR